MARVLITGSSSGIGRAGANALVAQGHEVVLHARNERRAAEAGQAVPGALGIAIGDLSSFAATRKLAVQAAEFGPYDTIVLNAGVGRLHDPDRALSEDGNELTFQVNTLSAYLLTALLPRPKRLVFTSSALAGQGVLDLDDPNYERRPYHGREAYCSTKLHLVLLAFGLGRRWPEVESIAFDPGFVATQMTVRNGDVAPLDAQHAGDRLARVAVAGTTAANRYDTERAWQPGAAELDPARQDGLLRVCATLTGVTI
ncbi:SDR family NAD(P)-dependent oxidoreductase [Catenuloplanes atrovinosus]|uniref:NAD(P)-dependent dehydrogenase (Short-subunit alcohol dehydrogenase family) n=1 Tax=Catenuloplanes atrovinosus TaxID=137266 RepID=A0AAE3YSP1_9ACTN|nr:SDR family NAD(P)-dependent oxidoreductase [Catenuloplanes atrovinosus]MDR7277915.1 NAD(P)-dependent dehydrogenase (short-subunit alcohol dehydrogenase family) [Catenuloplanes atrovinosus]